FGNTVEAVEKVQNRFRYAGEQFDPVTGQYYLRARFYNPVIGRFTQEDTYRGDGLNLYAYVQNNPVKYYDPSGYCSESKQGMKYPERTLEAQAECQKVVDILNSLKASDDISTPVVTVFIHEDGTVSIGISGKSGGYNTRNTANMLEEALNKEMPGKYKVSPVIDKKLMNILLQTGKGQPGNPIGNCAEPKAVTAASVNTSPITGMDTRWRLSEEVKPNPHKYTGPNATDISQMNPCDTCKVYESEYMLFANQNKRS
ncbi:MAG TPA: RHS repeat-associated core domain-containing protein, partial [Pseudobacteroides sp.]|nr:RHS repeat-associated core domain-containing protein [Pseudobacteroides sp.]